MESVTFSLLNFYLVHKCLPDSSVDDEYRCVYLYNLHTYIACFYAYLLNAEAVRVVDIWFDKQVRFTKPNLD